MSIHPTSLRYLNAYAGYSRRLRGFCLPNRSPLFERVVHCFRIQNVELVITVVLSTMAALLLVSHIYPQIMSIEAALMRGECDTFMRHIGHDLLASGSWILWATAFQANRKSTDRAPKSNTAG